MWLMAIVSLILLVPLVLFLTGALYPARALAKELLKKDLARNGIDILLFPQACINELAAHLVDSAKSYARVMKGNYRNYLAEKSMGIAYIVSSYTFGTDQYHTTEAIKRDYENGMTPVVWEILARTDPERFALERLANTQSMNVMMRNIIANEDQEALQLKQSRR